jgi:hypothetical protein
VDPASWPDFSPGVAGVGVAGVGVAGVGVAGVERVG